MTHQTVTSTIQMRFVLLVMHLAKPAIIPTRTDAILVTEALLWKVVSASLLVIWRTVIPMTTNSTVSLVPLLALFVLVLVTINALIVLKDTRYSMVVVLVA